MNPLANILDVYSVVLLRSRCWLLWSTSYYYYYPLYGEK